MKKYFIINLFLISLLLNSCGNYDNKKIIYDYKKYDNIYSLNYIPNSNSLIYTIEKIVEGKKKLYIIKDGKELGEGYSPIFSPDGKSFAYIKVKNEKMFVVKDGKELGEGYSPIFSPDLKSFSYIGTNNEKGEGKEYLVKDGIKGKNYDSIIFVRYSPDSKSITYRARTGWDSHIIKDGIDLGIGGDFEFSPDGKSYFFIKEEFGMNKKIIKDGKELGEGENPMFSPDSKSFAYIKKGNNWYGKIIKDGKELGEGIGLQFSPDSNSFVYIKVKNEKMFVVKDGKELGEGYSPIFSPDSKSFSFVGIDRKTKSNIKDGIKVNIIKDGIKQKSYDNIYSITYSPDSKNIVYIACIAKTKIDGKCFIVKNGIEGKYNIDLKNVLLSKFMFSENSKSYAYEIEKDGKKYIIKDGKNIGEGRDLIFSPDSKSFVYIAKKDRKEYIKYLKN